MTEVRDWHKDMELAHHARYEFVSMQPRHLNTLIDALFHWLQQYAHEANEVCYWKGEATAEKARADKAEAEAEKWRIEAFRKYPTPEAYELACAALHKHRELANEAKDLVGAYKATVRAAGEALIEAEKREKKLREAIEQEMPDMLPTTRIVLRRVLASLYPLDKEEEAK